MDLHVVIRIVGLRRTDLHHVACSDRSDGRLTLWTVRWPADWPRSVADGGRCSVECSGGHLNGHLNERSTVPPVDFACSSPRLWS